MPAETKRTLYQLLERWRAAAAGSNLPQPPAYHGPDISISALVEHTDEVRPEGCFVARVRQTSDGHRYIPQAVARGATLVIGEKAPDALTDELPASVTYLQVADSALAYAWLSAAWEGFPGKELVIIGVTGTDGKTTTANMLHEILLAAGVRAGLLSTLRAVIGRSEEPLALHVTTPEAPTIQRYLRRMVDAGLTHVVLEATSHGLAQQRVAAIPFDIGVVTNITHEHLDYHGSWEGYLAAKRILFEKVADEAWPRVQVPHKRSIPRSTVLNGDDESYPYLRLVSASHQLVYTLHSNERADVYATGLRYEPEATHFRLHLPDRRAVDIAASMVGDFNVYNMLAAAAAAYAAGVGPADIRMGLERVRALTGRMQRIDVGQPFVVVVDFAHTPNGLEKAISAARRMTSGRVITVFGSAGKRDVAKRYLMAEIAARDADLAVLTAEDPRTESLDEILSMMAEGARRAGGREGESFWRVRDRGAAIYRAAELAAPADLVLICGKGHEQSMCFGITEYPWDDVEAARTVLQAYLHNRPVPDLGLPTFTK